jgi:Zn-dependent protease with chaperone function
MTEIKFIHRPFKFILSYLFSERYYSQQTMYIRKITLLIALLGMAFGIRAQEAIDFNNYEPLKSKGKLPKDVTTLSSEKYQKELEKIQNKDLSRSEKRLEKQFQLQNNFAIDRLLLSGDVVYNDPIAEYITKVAQEVLKEDISTFKKLRFYTVKSPAVNAYTTNGGIIFINVGLLAQLENEAQLAFILCHEIVHFKKKHNINSYKESKKIDQNKDYLYRDRDDKVVAKCAYSKELETEADIEGFKMFKDSKYKMASTNGVFDVLEYAHLPFDEVSFNISFFEMSDFKFPAMYQKADSQLIPIKGTETEKDKKKSKKDKDDDEETTTTDDDENSTESDEDAYDDKYSTHPNVSKRRQKIESLVDGLDDKTRKEFLVSKEEFLNMRKLARFECVHSYVNNYSYDKAIYSSYILLKENPKSIFLKKAIARSLYSLAKIKNKSGKVELSDVHTKFKKTEGSIGALCFLIDKLTADASELTTLAMRYNWEIHKELPDDVESKIMAQEMMYALIDKYKTKISDYSFTKEVSEKKDQDKGEDKDKDEESTKSKYAKIKKKKKKAKEESLSSSEKAYKYKQVAKYAEEADFKENWQTIADLVEKNNADETPEAERKRLKEERTNERKGYALGVDKILVSDPLYAKVDLRASSSEKAVKQIASEEALVQLDAKISELSKLLNLDVVSLNSKTLDENDAERLNELAVINNFLTDEHLSGDIGLLSNDYQKLVDISKKYDTRHVMYVGVLSLTIPRDKSEIALYACYSVMTMGLALPFMVYAMTKPNTKTYIVTYVYDILSGNTSMEVVKEMTTKDKDYILKMHLYDAMFQIKNSRSN